MDKYAFVVGGTHSGCGKTTISLGLMAALKRQGVRVQGFKVGPDFIDPGLHRLISGKQSYNLDGWMLAPEYNISRFQELVRKTDIAVIEGVMGIYDGYDGISERGSTAEIAKWLGLPVVLVVDARSMARSIAALIRGFMDFDKDIRFAGVILNRIGGKGHLSLLKEAVHNHLPDLTILGGIPRHDNISLPERHLGLVTADELQLPPRFLEELADLVDQNLDWVALKTQTRYNNYFGNISHPKVEKGPPVTIAVARDEAFCFYYPDNLELLEKCGAKIRFFSPLKGENIPEDAGAVYLGGGYPEVHAPALSRNRELFDHLRYLAEKGLPIYAECGGLMVLGRYIETTAGKRYSMAGILPFATKMLTNLVALGYTEVQLRKDCLLGKAGTIIRGHEFHYSEIVEMDGEMDLAYKLQTRKSRKSRLEGYSLGSVLASYVHLHWGSNPRAAASLVNHARRYKGL